MGNKNPLSLERGILFLKEQYDKPFMEYADMISQLEKRNVVFYSKEKAIEILKRVSYYHLINGYKDLFNPDNNNVFKYTVYFEQFYLLYRFDSEFNSIIFKYIISIEKALKSSISYIVSKQYGVNTDLRYSYDIKSRKRNYPSIDSDDDYLNPKNYTNNRNIVKKVGNTLKRIKREAINTLENDRSLSMTYYYNNHNHIPPWILTNCISFGDTILWYNILESNDKGYVCDCLLNSSINNNELKKKLIFNSLTILRKYRNFIAHGNPVFRYSINTELSRKEIKFLSNNHISNNEYYKGLGKNDIFAVIMIIVNLIDNERKNIFINEITQIMREFGRYTYANGSTLLQMLSLPDDFLDRINQLI